MALQQRLQLKMVTPVRTVFEQDVDGVTIPTTLGQITVLPHHVNLVSILAGGELIVRDGDKQFPLAITGGILEVCDNILYILADAAEHATEIDIDAAELRAKQLEQDLKERTDLDLTSYSLLQRNLEAERLRLTIGKKWRHLK